MQVAFYRALTLKPNRLSSPPIHPPPLVDSLRNPAGRSMFASEKPAMTEPPRAFRRQIRPGYSISGQILFGVVQ
jgi:hypothetical protein